jgi:hypothetical protein
MKSVMTNIKYHTFKGGILLENEKYVVIEKSNLPIKRKELTDIEVMDIFKNGTWC